MQEKVVPHGFIISTREHVMVSPEEFEAALLSPRSIALWNNLTLKDSTDPYRCMDVGDAMEFTAHVGVLSFDYVMITASRIPGVSFVQRTTKGFLDVNIEYSWKPKGVGTLVSVDTMYRLTGSLWWKKPLAQAVARRSARQAARNMRDMFSPRRMRGSQ